MDHCPKPVPVNMPGAWGHRQREDVWEAQALGLLCHNMLLGSWHLRGTRRGDIKGVWTMLLHFRGAGLALAS